MNKLLIILLYLTFLSCNDQEASKITEIIKQSSSYENNWKIDSQGCLKLRNRELAESLIKKYNLERKTMEDFKQVFGHANDTKVMSEKNVLIYYFDCICEGGVIVQNSDKCYAEFYFRDNKLIDKIFICE